MQLIVFGLSSFRPSFFLLFEHCELILILLQSMISSAYFCLPQI